ncbi:MAG TPA: type IX secretion system sortase PorU [Saprospiraceae bacterium]|nr:type IX secretion system sortase PorU [Saprospiraceae bacterium]
MKSILKVLLGLFPYILFAQQSYTNTFNFEWINLDKSNKGLVQKGPIDIFNGALRDQSTPDIPVLRYEIPLQIEGSINIKLLVNQSEIVNFNSTGTLNQIPNLEDDFVTRYSIFNERGRTKAIVELIPLKKSSHQSYERILSCKIDVFFVPNIVSRSPNTPPYTYNSILKSGNIYKIALSNKGIYKLDKNYLEKNLKISLASVDPKNIHIYGNGGVPLPESNSVARIDDLKENSLYINGEEDGVFDENDYILFYANGPDSQIYNEGSEDFLYTKNPYSQKSYYYIKIDNTPGLRVLKNNFIESGNYVSSSGLLSIHHEKELYNLLDLDECNHGSGQKWYGEDLGNSRSLDLNSIFYFPGLDQSRKTKLKALFASRSNRTSTLNINVDGESVSKSLSTIGYSCTSNFAANNFIFSDLNLKNELPKIKITFPDNGSSSDGWLDWIQLTAWRKYDYLSKPLFVFDPESKLNSFSTYKIANPGSNLFCWNITSSLNPVEIPYKVISGNLEFTDESFGKLSEYLVFDPSANYPAPEYIGSVENQNLHGLEIYDFAIIYYKDFKNEAERLLQHRQKHSNIKGVIVDVDHIYNEFGCGSKDPTAIRDFLRMLYLRNPQFRYVTLLGAASYDFRYLNTKIKDQNLVSTYETSESLDPINSFPTDDYFGLLDENEGENLAGLLDLSIGRILARTQEEARDFVDKIIRYDTDPNTYADWRLNLIFSGDDEDGNIHMSDMDRIAQSVKSQNPLFNQQKIYLDAYEQITTPGGERYPEVNKAINTSVFTGALVFSYMGHGGPTGLGQERILQDFDIRQWDNLNKMFLMVTATCTFTGFDDPEITSAGQLTMLQKGGTIGMFSTVRAVYASENYQLTNSVFNNFYGKENGKFLTMGEILTRSKNQNSAPGILQNSRKFLLFGDPSQTLAYPILENEVLSINDRPLGPILDTIRALQTVRVKGRVKLPNGQTASDFNGLLYTTVFDKPIDLKTRANDPSSREQTFSIQKNIIFKGNSEVKNGEWEFTFIVPKDINFSIGQGKISLYATNEKNLDASGYTDKFLIGGFTSDTTTKDLPPVVKLYINNDQFVSGGITDENPKIFARISDDMGINISGNSIGHDLSAIIDLNTESPIILNNFFKSQLNDYRSGEITYPLKNLKPGKHTLSLIAWDITNNQGSANIEFNVIDNDDISLERVLNYPNPFNRKTNFQFETNLTGLPLEVTIYIQSISGKMVKTIQKNINMDGYRTAEIEWDGTDDFGSKLANGVYLYQIRVSGDTGTTSVNKRSKHQKLLILH